MDPNKTFRIILIVTVSTLVTILTPVQSKSVFRTDSFVARSLLSVFPPSNPPSELESPSPAPANPNTDFDLESPAESPEAPTSSISPANPPMDSDMESPAASPDVPAVSISPTNAPSTEIAIDSPAASPEALSNSAAPANSPTDIDMDSPAASPELSSDFISPTNPPTTEIDTESPAASPGDSISPANPPTEIDTDSPAASPEASDSFSSTNPLFGSKIMNTPKNLLNQPLLSPEIKTICSKTDYPTLCESSIKPLLTPQLKPDASSILILAIQASINQTKSAIGSVDKVAATECQEMYDEAVANLEDAINAVKANDIATVNINLSAALTDYSTCNDGFEESGEPNLLADLGGKLTKMVSNCLAISTLIK